MSSNINSRAVIVVRDANGLTLTVSAQSCFGEVEKCLALAEQTACRMLREVGDKHQVPDGDRTIATGGNTA